MTKQLTPVEAAAEERAFMRDRYPDWPTFSPAMKLEAHARYIAAQTKVEGPSPLQSFERQMLSKFGSGFRTLMSPLDKMHYGALLDKRPNAAEANMTQREKDWQRLAQLKAGGADDTPNVKVARLGLIADLERKLAGGKS